MQFEPGESVACESTELSDGVVLVAVQRRNEARRIPALTNADRSSETTAV